MNNFFKNNDYLVFKDFLHSEIVFAHYQHVIDLYRNTKLSEDKEQVLGSYVCRDDMVFDTLLSKLTPLISKVTNKELWPTYSFVRFYRKGDILEYHMDRESCEYSISLTLGYSGEKTWPLYLKTKNNKKVKIKLDVGEALIYKGREMPHWRKKLKGDHHVQVFLHYIDSNGPYKEWLFDKRPGLVSLDYNILEPKFLNT